MSTIVDLVDAIRNDLVVLNVPIILEMAIYSGKQPMYSDLSKLSLSRMSPFAESFMLLGLGDNLSLSLDERTSIVVARISEMGVLIIVTNQKIGTVLIKLKEVMEKYGKRVDELLGGKPVSIPSEVKLVGGPRPIVAPRLEQVTPPSQQVRMPTPIPAPVIPATAPPPSVAIGTFMAPILVKKEALKNSSGDERKILSLCTGRFSIEEISKKTKMPAKAVIEALYKFSQNGTLELREEKKTATEEAINFLKSL